MNPILYRDCYVDLLIKILDIIVTVWVGAFLFGMGLDEPIIANIPRGLASLIDCLFMDGNRYQIVRWFDMALSRIGLEPIIANIPKGMDGLIDCLFVNGNRYQITWWIDLRYLIT